MQPRSRYRKLHSGGCSVPAGAEFPAQGWVHLWLFVVYTGFMIPGTGKLPSI